MKTLEDALSHIVQDLAPLPSELVPLPDSFGRFAACEIRSRVDVPGFDNSAMDGFAVRARDVTDAAPDRPVRLKLAGHIPAGTCFRGKLDAGCCIRLFTGSPLPQGADAVVMQEDTRRAGSPDEIEILDPVKPWQHVRLQGEDFKRNSVIWKAGMAVTPAAVALLGAAGIDQLAAGQKPKVGIIATGAELRTPGQPLGPGEIYESNRLMISALVRKAGGVPAIFPLVTDSLEATRHGLETAFASSDIVVTSGGVSVGEHDYVKEAFQSAGGDLAFWRIAIKPGKPFVYGKLGCKRLFGLPGNPISAAVTCWLLVRPALLRLQGAVSLEPPNSMGVLAEPMQNNGDRRHFLRVQLSPEGKVRSAGTQASHMLSSFSQSNGLLDLPPNTRMESGTLVKVIRMD